MSAFISGNISDMISDVHAILHDSKSDVVNDEIQRKNQMLTSLFMLCDYSVNVKSSLQTK